MNQRMAWSNLLDPTRIREVRTRETSHKVAGELRTEYERDRDRTVYSSPVRRLIGKTQVFPLDSNDLVRTRLVHSLEVSTVAEGLAAQATRDVIRKREDLSEDQQRSISKIAETCGLLHDVGNPPFGHAGEQAIASWFTNRVDSETKEIAGLGNVQSQAAKDFLLFEGNAQTFRIITNTRLLAHDCGLNLTCATTAAIRKYLAASNVADKDSTIHENTKPGYFMSEDAIFAQVGERTSTIGRRHPIAYLVEAADDIVYCVVDLEDALKKHLLTWRTVLDYLSAKCQGAPLLQEIIDDADKQMKSVADSSQLWASEYPQAFRVNAISAMVRSVVDIFGLRYDKIMMGEYHDELVYDDECSASIFIGACKELLRETVFRDKDVLRLEVRGRRVIHDLMDLFWEGASSYLKDRKTQTRSYGGKLYLLISENYRYLFEKRLQAAVENESYCAYQLVTDYVSGMTDAYACRLHTDLMNGRIG